jgi:Fe2+ or Zn2+ uptake regulation protein
MTNISLAQSYLVKATKRLRILDVLLEEDDHSDVVREAQEIVELAQKAMRDALLSVETARRVVTGRP